MKLCKNIVLMVHFLCFVRCVKSEGECEKLQQKSLDLKRKVDDMTTALHEMGRENQSLQVNSI